MIGALTRVIWSYIGRYGEGKTMHHHCTYVTRPSQHTLRGACVLSDLAPRQDSKNLSWSPI